MRVGEFLTYPRTTVPRTTPERKQLYPAEARNDRMIEREFCPHPWSPSEARVVSALPMRSTSSGSAGDLDIERIRAASSVEKSTPDSLFQTEIGRGVRHSRL